MKNTVIVISQKCTTTHEIRVKGEISKEQERLIDFGLSRATHPDDMYDIVSKAGLEIVDGGDMGGCWEGSDFEWDDTYEEEAGE